MRYLRLLFANKDLKSKKEEVEMKKKAEDILIPFKREVQVTMTMTLTTNAAVTQHYGFVVFVLWQWC